MGEVTRGLRQTCVRWTLRPSLLRRIGLGDQDVVLDVGGRRPLRRHAFCRIGLGDQMRSPASSRLRWGESILIP